MDLPQFDQLFDRAAAALPGVHPSAADLSDWLRKRIEDDDVLFMVALDPGIEPKGYVVICLGTDIWNPHPWVASFHSDTPAARKSLVEGMHREMTERGITKLLAINQTGASDRAYAWLWRGKAEVRVIGPAVEFRFDLLTSPTGSGKETA